MAADFPCVRNLALYPIGFVRTPCPDDDHTVRTLDFFGENVRNDLVRSRVFARQKGFHAQHSKVRSKPRRKLAHADEFLCMGQKGSGVIFWRGFHYAERYTVPVNKRTSGVDLRRFDSGGLSSTPSRPDAGVTGPLEATMRLRGNGTIWTVGYLELGVATSNPSETLGGDQLQ